MGPPPAKFKKARPDDVVDRRAKTDVKLYHVSNATGQLVVTEIGQRPLQQSMLDHSDCYCLDQAGQAVFVWKGRRADPDEKSGCISKATKYMQGPEKSVKFSNHFLNI